MSQLRIPNEKTGLFTRSGQGEIFGTLWATRNIDLFANRGKLRLSERIYKVAATTYVPVAALKTDAAGPAGTQRYFALLQQDASGTTNGRIWRTTTYDPLTGWALDNSAPTNVVDNAVVFEQESGTDRLVAACANGLAKLANGTWTPTWWTTAVGSGGLGQAALTTTNPHFIYKYQKLLLIPDGNVLHTVDNNSVVNINRIVLPPDYQIVWIHDDGRRVYLGTRNKNGGEAHVFPWNGGESTYDDPIPVYDYVSFAGTAKAGVLYTINGKGQLLFFNGASFEEIDTLPVFSEKHRWSDAQYVVHPNGMKIIDGNIHILLNSSIDQQNNFLENMHAGVWVYEKGSGLYHKYGLSLYDGATNDDWGAACVKRVGALCDVGMNNGHILIGASIYSDDFNTEVPAILASKVRSTVYQRGQFVTPQISSPDVWSFFQTLKAVFRQASGDSLVIKYRTSKNAALYSQANIVWTSTSTFTSTSAAFAVASVGDEIEIVSGKGAGATAHILTSVKAGSTYTITLDEAIPNVTGNAMAIVRNFRKLATMDGLSETLQNKTVRIARRAEWIQFKVELRGNIETPELAELITTFQPLPR